MNYGALVLAALATALAGCGTEPAVCSAELTAITTSVVNRTGQALPFPQVVDTVVRTGAVLELGVNTPEIALTEDSAQPVVILNDDFLGRVRPEGDVVVVTVRAGDHVTRGQYVLGSNACHVQQLAGPDSLVFQ
jgi:hypothetical protein